MKEILIFLACGLLASELKAGDKAPGFMITFHDEGDAVDGPKHVQPGSVMGDRHFFHKQPFITQNNMKAYWPFRSEDGVTWGAVFWLDTGGQHALQRVGVTSKGGFIAAAVNAQPVDVMMVDGVPPDGRIVVWKGLSQELFKVIDKEKKIKRVGDPAASGVAATAPTPGKPGQPAKPGQPVKPVAVPASAPGAPLPDGAVVSNDVDPAVLNAATADMNLDGKKASSRWNPLNLFKKKDTKPAAPAPAVKPQAVIPPFKPEADAERPDITPLADPTPTR